METPMKNDLNQRIAFFLVLAGLACLMAYGPVKWLYDSTANREYYSHIVLIPLVSLYLIFQSRKRIFSEVAYSFKAGIPFMVLGAVLYLAGQEVESVLSHNDFASLMALSAVVFLQGAFMLCFSYPAYKSALFPLLFLVFAIPIPRLMMDGMIYLLQVGSTEFANLLFTASGVPFFREGFAFHLAGMSVEVAKECSGIRSGLALFITAVLAGHLFLRTGWKKILLAVIIFPITMFKNGLRILILTLLGTYVDPRWVTHSSLHTDGGIVFFVLALLLLAPVLLLLRKGEGRSHK
jgi:exosortase